MKRLFITAAMAQYTLVTYMAQISLENAGTQDNAADASVSSQSSIPIQELAIEAGNLRADAESIFNAGCELRQARHERTLAVQNMLRATIDLVDVLRDNGPQITEDNNKSTAIAPPCSAEASDKTPARSRWREALSKVANIFGRGPPAQWIAVNG